MFEKLLHLASVNQTDSFVNSKKAQFIKKQDSGVQWCSGRGGEGAVVFYAKIFTVFFCVSSMLPYTRTSRACHQLTDFVTRTALFENRIAEYIDVFEKRKPKGHRPKGHRNVRFAVQKIIIDDTP